MYDMKNSNQTKDKRLNRVLTVRLTDSDYNTLLTISETSGSDISKVIRTITRPIVDLTKENNLKDK
jgi:hypothetical protein